MEANELRIGNRTSKGTIKSFYEYGVHFGYGNTFAFNDIDLLPLTKEWLLKFGFNESEGEYSDEFSKDDFILLKISNNQYFTEITNGVKVNSVHQLQNLYFALTGEELTI